MPKRVFLHLLICIFLGNKCYRVAARKDPAPWTRALEQCKSYGADLVSIHSQEEQGNSI